MEGYDYTFQENIAKDPGTHHFNGIITPEMMQEVQNFKPDAILIYGWAWNSHLKALRFFKDKFPIYFRGDSTLLDQQKSFKSVLRKYFLNWVYSHIDKAFYVGEANKNYFKKYGLNDLQLHFASHAVDNERFSQGRKVEADRLRQKFGVADQEILILFAGKFEVKKNPSLLLEAFNALNLPNVHLLFVGNGDLEGSLKRKVEGLGTKRSFDYAQDDKEGRMGFGVGSLEKKINEKSFDYAQDDNIKKRIHFMDFQNQTEMPVVYQACDLFCLPSKGPGETWGLAVNEAMAAGKAVLVSTKVGCAVDLVKPGINGEVFRSNDLDDLMRKLGELTSSKEKLTKMGIQSQQIIQNWSFEKQVEAIVDTIYNNDAK
ncbi:glycosyltransferase family 4 protein [Pedobacter borealis]|uniref:glycosyltransferase family 4 protein n=1 Tax=Pedobacter borealis TaxID=475254 RepID=UPI001ADF0670|nr:glycosyltransferase family 4 protein [Pedobacter borealis]